MKTCQYCLQPYAAGVWDELTVNFVFKRRYGWYLLQGYIPTYMTIFISWIPFYLGPRAIPARTMIGVVSKSQVYLYMYMYVCITFNFNTS